MRHSRPPDARTCSARKARRPLATPPCRGGSELGPNGIPWEWVLSRVEATVPARSIGLPHLCPTESLAWATFAATAGRTTEGSPGFKTRHDRTGVALSAAAGARHTPL